MTKKSDVVEDFHGTKVADPYRWMEDPAAEETVAWCQEIADSCHTYFQDITSKEEDRKRLVELWNYPKHFVPKKINELLFYQQNDGLQNQAVLYKKSDEGISVVIDPNKLSDDGTVAMTNYSFSKNGEYIAYATSKHGSDWQEIRIKDIASGKDLSDLIEYVKFTSIAWAPDASGFYYSRFPRPGTVSPEEEGNYNKVYFHKLGTSQTEDTFIFEDPNNHELMFSPFITDDEKYLGLHVFYGTASENRFFLSKLSDSNKVIRLLDDQDAEYTYITNSGNVFYFKTDLDAPRGRVIAINIEQPERLDLQEVISETDDVIDGVKYVNGTFVVAYLHDAHHQIKFFDKSGKCVKKLDLPLIGSLTGISGENDSAEIYFGMTSFLSPTVIYSYNIETDTLDVFAESELELNIDDYITEQIFYTSKDGTKVPMFLTHKKGLERHGKNPVILYGYGGFNVSITPSFNPAILRWLEKGGVYAVANIRGGMEYGEEWHRAGMLEKKQNVFDDFISAGEWLIENDYTSSNYLSIMGGSNGGLLVAACMVQRPDLFGAVICRVPVIDMLRYHKFTIGRYWIPEYGNAENPEHFPFLYAYSPLHNVKEGVKYPAVLIATAESDDRVVPAHAKKFAATLLEKAAKDSVVVLRLEAKAGHGLGKPTSKQIDEWVDFYAFLEKELEK